MTAVALLLVAYRAAAQCPNECRRHGVCRWDETCACEAGRGGPDCSLRECTWGPDAALRR